MRHLILVRHGESALNAANRQGAAVFCGQFETPLTERGRQQACEVGVALGRRGDLQIRHAISSCLGCAIETLALLCSM